MKKIFVTGGTGFIGSAVVKALIQFPKYEIYILTRQPKVDEGQVHYVRGEISDKDALKNMLEIIKPEILLHFAWNVKAMDYASSIENLQWQAWSQNLVQLFLQNGGKHVIGSGTCFEYDFSTGKLLTEDMRALPKTVYGKCKLATYETLKKLCGQYEARLVWGRIFYPYGLGEEARKLISTVRRQLLANRKFVCQTPNNVVDYIHIEDIAAIFSIFVFDLKAEGIINICTGKGYKISEILTIIARQIKKEEYLFLQENECRTHIVGTNQKLLVLKYKYKYDLLNGLKTYGRSCF